MASNNGQPRSPYSQQRCNWFRSRGENMLNTTRKRIYEINEGLGKRADRLVEQQKTSFIQNCAHLFRGKNRPTYPYQESVKKFLDEATVMIPRNRSVSPVRPLTRVMSLATVPASTRKYDMCPR